MQTRPIVFLNCTDKTLTSNGLWYVLFLILFCPFLLARSVEAQSIQQFVGNVVDSSHAVIVGAVVTIHNEGTGENVVVKSNRAGDYTAAYLKTGLYTVSAEKPGFKTLSFTHVCSRTVAP